MQLRQFSILVVGLIGLIGSTLAYALGLGDVTVKSSYNEPLNAEIRLLQTQNLSKEEILVALASREDFSRIGLDRDFFLTNLLFEVVLDNPNNPHIRVTSEKPVQEPYLNFLVDTQWPSGRLLREYTVLLDLPVFETEQAAPPVIQPAVSTPVVAEVPAPVAPPVVQAPPPVVNQAVSEPVSQPASEQRVPEVKPEPVVQSTPAPEEKSTVVEAKATKSSPTFERNLASNSSRFSKVEDAADSFIRSLSRQAAERKSSFQIQPPPLSSSKKVVAKSTISKDLVKSVVARKESTNSVPVLNTSTKTVSGVTKRVIRTESKPSAPPPVQQNIARNVSKTSSQVARQKVSAVTPERSDSQAVAKDRVRVQAGDTLWKIASQLRPNESVSVQQTMLALQEANPDAFINNNINLLRKGQVFRAPTLSEIEQTSFRQAVAAVKQQAQAWQQQTQKPVLSAVQAKPSKKSVPTKQEGRVTLGAADNSDKSKAVKGAGTSGKGESLQNDLAIAQEELDKASRENSNLKTRIAELEEQIKTLEGLVSLTSDQFKALELSTEKNKSEELKPSAENKEKEVAQTQEQSVQEASEENLLIEKLTTFVTNNIQLLAIALLVLLIIILLVIRLAAKNKKDEDDFELESDFEPLDSEYDEAFENIRDDDELYDLDELDDDLSDSQSIEVQTDDAVAEADIYIGLGQTDNAEKLLQREIQQNPENADARIALLKLYVQTQNADAFDDQYAQLLPLGNADANQQAKELRNDIEDAAEFDVDSYSLEEPDFSVSDNLVGDDFDEFDLDGDDEPLPDLDDEPELMELNLDDDDDDDDDEEEILKEDSIEEVEPLNLEEKTPFEPMPETTSLDEVNEDEIDISDSAELDDLSFDIDDELLSELSSEDEFVEVNELEAVDDSDDFNLDIDEELLEDLSSPDPLDEDDLDLDLDLLDLDTDEDSEEVQDIEPEKDVIDQPIDDTEAGIEEIEESLDISSVDDMDLDLNGDIDEPPVDTNAQSNDEIDRKDPVEFDIDAPPSNIDIASIDKELDAMTAALEEESPVVKPKKEDDVVVNASPMEEEFDLSDDELGFVDNADEVETKLDLARAYLDMGDKEGAQDILQEVIDEGNTEQKQEANKLLDDL